MNRNNFLIHVALAIVLILVAAFAGQLNRWRKHWKAQMRIVPAEEKARPQTPEQIAIAETEERGTPEVLVKFKSGVSSQTIEALEARINDRIVDRIENAPGWTAIDDMDDASPADVVAQYRALPEVEYAEENFAIEIPDAVHSSIEPVRPHDPQFEEQWALSNSGQRGGKEGADISAMLAWATTTGSDDLIVAVLDTGVDYTHEDLLANMWLRPASMTPYQDNELGTVDDVRGFNAVDNTSDPMDDNGHGTHLSLIHI